MVVFQGASPPTTNLNPHADVTLEAAFFGYLFDRIELDVGSGTMPMDITFYFPIWFQLMCHLQPLDFKTAHGDAMGYIPDTNSGQAIASTNPYINLINIGGAALAAGAQGTFGIFAVVTPTAAVAANAAFPWTIPGTNITLNLSAPVALVANTTYPGIFQIAVIAALNAAATSTYNYPGLSLPCKLNSCMQL